jgi:hypothetical protein
LSTSHSFSIAPPTSSSSISVPSTSSVMSSWDEMPSYNPSTASNSVSSASLAWHSNPFNGIKSPFPPTAITPSNTHDVLTLGPQRMDHNGKSSLTSQPTVNFHFELTRKLSLMIKLVVNALSSKLYADTCRGTT